MDYNIAFLITLKYSDRFLKYFNKLKKNINYFHKYFPNLTVIFVYDDTDNLNKMLNNFKQVSKFKVIYKKIKNTSKIKTIRIATARNKWCLRDVNLEINENNVESCEHLFYHLSAIKENNCRIRISKFSKD